MVSQETGQYEKKVNIIILIMIKKKLADLSKSANFLHIPPTFWFSSDILNVRVPLVDPSTHKPTDQYIYRYENPMFSAYMEKRRLTRSEIWPKIHILEGAGRQEQPHLRYQKLFQLKKVMDEDMMKRIAEQDPTLINSAYIISMFSEDNFKELIDAYCSKVLVSGKAPSSEEQAGIEEKVIQYFRMYYFGQPITPLQKEIQAYYLAAKQQKWLQRKVTPKNAYLRCNWRPQDQRLLEDYVNWPDTDLNLSDLNYRPYYEPLCITQRLPHAQKFNQLLAGNSFLRKMFFNFTYKENYKVSSMFISVIVEKIFSRTVQYSNCLEFTHKMKIPPDFSIQLCVLNLNMWLILNRLKQFDSKLTKKIAQKLTNHFKRYITQTVGTIHVKRQVAAQKNFQNILKSSSQTLTFHFSEENTNQSVYKNVDALVWSCALMEKVERYGEEVYILSEYLVKNWQNLQKMDEKDFLDGMCELDPFLYDPDFVEKIKAINPPLDAKTFEEQFNSDKADKSYYYRINQEYSPFVVDATHATEDYSYSFTRTLFNKIFHVLKKYLTNMDEYDTFSQMDEQKRKKEKMAKKSPWKTDSDSISQIDSEFELAQKIRRSYRNSSNVKDDNV